MLTKNTDQLRRVVAEHIAQDAVVQGVYWDKITSRGCFIGCLAHGNKPGLNEQQYGDRYLALADDGTAWFNFGNGWTQLDPLPAREVGQ